MMDVKLYSVVHPQMMQNNASKQFSTSRKILGQVYNCYFLEIILQQFWYYMGTQIKDLHKSVPVTKKESYL